MKVEIKCRFSGKVLFAHDQEENSVKTSLEIGVKARENLSGAYLSGAYLDGAYLSGANLDGANLDGANLSGAYLDGAYLSGAYLDGAYLSGANLSGANLSGANLSGAYLDGAYLSGANLDGANLSGANLSGANLSGANLDGATYGEGVEVGNNPLFIFGLTWPIYIFRNHIRIGCQIHRKQEWIDMSDSDIEEMEERALCFWKQWKKHILWMAFEVNHEPE